MVFNRPDELVPAANALPDTAGTRFLAADLMNKRGFNPIEKLMDLADEMEGEDEQENFYEKRMKLYTTLAKYYAPQPKSVDINVKTEGTITVQAVDYTSLVAERAHLIPQAYRGPQLMNVVEAVLEASDGD